MTKDSTMQQQRGRVVIAIDGGSASGKSTTAAAVANALGFLHVDSGALYRAVCWKVLAERIRPEDSTGVKELLSRISFVVEAWHGKMRVCIDNAEIPDAALRTPEVTAAVSAVSAIPEVRALVNARLRALSDSHDVVVEGRDIGTAVFPTTPHKFFLKASPEARAQRRKADLEKLLQRAPSGARQSLAEPVADLEQVKAELTERDRKDSSRATDPLRLAPDAVVIDTTAQSVEQVVAKIVESVRAKASRGNRPQS